MLVVSEAIIEQRQLRIRDTERLLSIVVVSVQQW